MLLNKKYILALFTLMGTIIGVGMFGIPYAVLHSGVLWGVVHLVALTFITIFVHLYYGEVALRTRGKKRFVGYAEMYLGKWGKGLAFPVLIFSLLGSLLAYIIVAGHFLNALLSPWFGGDVLLYSVGFSLCASLIVLAGLKTVSSWEFGMTALLFVAAAFILVKGAPEVSLNRLPLANGDPLLPFGVILFSLGGMTVIPELEDLLTKKKAWMKSVIVWGTLIPAIFYALFTFVVLGVSGSNTSPEAISGIGTLLGKSVVYVGAVFGLLAVATSFFTIGLNLQSTLEYDIRIPKIIAWLCACGIPFLLFVLGLREFIPVIDTVGLVFGGCSGILTVLLWRGARKKGQDTPAYALRSRPWLEWCIIGVFLSAIVYEVVRFFW